MIDHESTSRWRRQSSTQRKSCEFKRLSVPKGQTMEKERKAQRKLAAENINTDDHPSPPLSLLHTKHQQIINQYLPIGIVESSLEGKYLNVNQEFCHMLGYEAEELLQRGIKDVTHEEDYHVDIKL